MDITEICMYCKNYFLKDYENSIHAGTYTIENGLIYPNPDFLKVGQYFNIHGSDLNDGVYQYTGDSIATLQNEIFEGSIWAMSVPPAFLKLCKEINDWCTKYENINSKNMSPFSSESVSGVYSYTKAGTSSESSGNLTTWQDAFKSKLNKWRKINIL
jgi:hypothetical protein